MITHQTSTDRRLNVCTFFTSLLRRKFCSRWKYKKLLLWISVLLCLIIVCYSQDGKNGITLGYFITSRKRHRFSGKQASTYSGFSSTLHNETEWLISYFHNFSTPEPCPEVPPHLVGRINFPLDVESEDIESFKNTESNFNFGVRAGGWWQPIGCAPRHHVAIVIPYRDREIHLSLLLSVLHPILQKQLIDYRIFVVEQFGNETFNKGRLMNVAFKTIQELHQMYNCVVFHDVDMVPEDDRNLYTCGLFPKHMSPAVSKFNYTLPYNELIGGVLAISFEHYIKVNGYSNVYWGWGGEDDDMYHRILFEKLHIIRPPQDVARYSMMYHVKRTWISHSKTYKLLGKNRRRYKRDGLNSITYQNLLITNKPLYTHILVNIGPPPNE